MSPLVSPLIHQYVGMYLLVFYRRYQLQSKQQATVRIIRNMRVIEFAVHVAWRIFVYSFDDLLVLQFFSLSRIRTPP